MPLITRYLVFFFLNLFLVVLAVLVAAKAFVVVSTIGTDKNTNDENNITIFLNDFFTCLPHKITINILYFNLSVFKRFIK